MKLGTCTACQAGDHSRHVRVVRAVPKGVMGGVICECKGECEHGQEQRFRDFMERIYGTDDYKAVAAALQGKRT